ncbi:MAG: DEAD/DEAH box helicase [Flavobacteriales bacterium]
MNDKSIIFSELDQFELDLSRFNSNDLLVNIQGKHVLPYEKETEELSSEAIKRIKSAHQKEREEGIFPLCLSEGILFFTASGHEQRIPIFLHLLRPKINPILNQVSWNVVEDEWLINPYLLHILSFEETEFSQLEKHEIYERLISKGYVLDAGIRFIGNFHPYRHSLLKEVIELKKKSDLSHFDFLYQGNQRVIAPNNPHLFPLLFESDHTQFEAIRRAEIQNLVIQGPPGTGKSQVIGNLIGRFLAAHKQVLLCSQKRQALEVIASKLTACGLEDLMLIRNSQEGMKTVMQSFYKSWEALEKPIEAVEQDLSSNIRLNWLQGQLDLYHKDGLIGTMSPKEFITKTHILKKRNIEFHAGMPSYSDWMAYKPIISEIPDSILQIFSLLKGNLNLEQTFESRINRIKQVKTEIVQLNWQHLSYAEILEHAQISQTVHLFSNEMAQRCLPWMKHRNKINRLIKKLELLDVQLKPLEPLIASWKNVPTLDLLSGLRNEVSKGGLFQQYHINRLKRTWLTHITTDFKLLIDQTLSYQTLLQEQVSIQLELIGLGLTAFRTDITAYNTFLTLFDGAFYEQYAALSKQERSFYCTHHTSIQQIAIAIKQHIVNNSKTTVYEDIERLISNFHRCIPYVKAWDQVPTSITGPLNQFDTIAAYEEAIICSDWNRFIAKFPGMNEFLSLSIADELASIKAHRKKTQQLIVHLVLLERKNKFDAFHRLIATSNSKLSAQEKALKEELIIGKRILSKLFSRKRNFPNLRSVLESEASHWMSILKPIWLSSPVQIAMDLPLIENSFDVAIIDEASQLLFSNSLGAIYRSKQLIVAGDSMQMAPSAFFQRDSANAITLLDQAAFNLPQSPLKFHYRSQHEDLIQFSNQHFYNNELRVFPSYPNYDAVSSIYLSGNNYVDGINPVEAQAAKDVLFEKLAQKDTRIGLVAFSEKQLKSIVSMCNNEEKLAIELAIESGVLFMKSVEQVQGDECDELILSFGYGYNEQGRFDLRFGPLTQEGGDKRLNVLFTRAKRKIHVIHSVRAEDFPMSENPTIHVLKQWFSFIEHKKSGHKQRRVLDVIDYRVEGSNIVIQRWVDLSPKLFDLLTYDSILSDRGWVIREEAFSSAPDHTRVLPLGDSVKSA